LSPPRNMTLSLPSWSKASFAPRSEPSASPSAFSWVTRRKRSCERIASATAVSSLVRCELIDQLRHANPPLDRRIVLEGQLGSPLHFQLPPDPGLQHSVGGAEAGERLFPLPGRAEHADVYARLPQVGRGVHAGDGDEP